MSKSQPKEDEYKDLLLPSNKTTKNEFITENLDNKNRNLEQLFNQRENRITEFINTKTCDHSNQEKMIIECENQVMLKKKSNKKY